MLKQLRNQGLPLRNLHTVFQAIVLSRLLYALPVWCPLLTVELVHKIDGFLKHSFRYGVTSKLLTIEPILNSAVEDLFCKMQLTNHCLHPLLPKQEVAVWCSGNALVLINAVALHRARLVLGWVTAFGQVNCLIT